MQSLHSVAGDVSVSFRGGSTVRSRNHEARVEISFAGDVSGGSYYVSQLERSVPREVVPARVFPTVWTNLVS